jgi:hypothetical protein
MIGLDDVTRDFVGLFETEKIPYALMGGLAVRVYALPRATPLGISFALEEVLRNNAGLE